MLTIFIWGGMNRSMALSVVVFPLAVPPQISIDWPFSMANQRYAIISGLMVRLSMRSRGVKGFSRKRRIVKLEPFLVTCLPSVA